MLPQTQSCDAPQRGPEAAVVGGGPQAGLAGVAGGGEEGHRQPRRHHPEVGQDCEVSGGGLETFIEKPGCRFN